MKRERLTITLDLGLLKAVDSLIDQDQLRNRSQTIEHLLKQGLGLHQLEQAFLFFEDEWQQNHLESFLNLLKGTSVNQLFISSAQTSDQSLLIQALAPDLLIQTIPIDFGSGGALILQKALLKNPFLVAWIGPNLKTPSTLLAPYLFHREHNQPLTQFLHTTDGQNFITSNVYIANPEILAFIPAGVADLQTQVFPELLKEAKIEGYVFS